MNALVELWRSGKHQREEKCADKPRGHDRPQRDHVAVAKTQLHYGDSASCGETSQARSGAVLQPLRYVKRVIGVLVFPAEARRGPRICLAPKARRYHQPGATLQEFVPISKTKR